MGRAIPDGPSTLLAPDQTERSQDRIVELRRLLQIGDGNRNVVEHPVSHPKPGSEHTAAEAEAESGAGCFLLLVRPNSAYNPGSIHPGRQHMPRREIRLDDLQGCEIRALLREHLENMHELSPPESVHALDIDGLRAPEVTFWSIWQDAELLGCGALKELDAHHGEIKSMRTAAVHRRQGVAADLLRHILQEAARRGYRRLSLETGSQDGFAPARTLYAAFGFEVCGPFADYREDPNSVFMTRAIRPG